MTRYVQVLSLLLALSSALLVGCGAPVNSTSATASSSETTSAAAAATASAPTVENQSIGLTSVNNARELGGYVGDGGRTVKSGVLLRTASLDKISDEDKDNLLNKYHLTTVIDFRSSTEVEATPDPELEGVTNLNLHIMDEAKIAEMASSMMQYLKEGEDPNDKIVRLRLAIQSGIVSDHMYVDFLSSDVGKAGYAAFFEQLAALPEGSSLLFHCTQGKDRTGMGAMLVLSVLGVDEQTIKQDFLLTNEFNADLIAKERQMLESKGVTGDDLESFLMAMDGVKESSYDEVISWLKENYGSPLAYVTKELGVGEQQIQALRDKFLA
ncbi:MAG: tyrosine-protein phosphatase [Coriobacteriales bacterium]|nr:tyrosine-protein phosphatase [Coriobacteriales bacterium]